MNKGKKAIIGIVIAGLVIGGAVYSMAAAGDPGSEADPLVTKSYVDSKISEMSGGSANVNVDEIVSRVLAQVNTQVGGTTESYTPLNIKEGNIMIASEGTEIILRSGIATVYVPGENGISDVTSGKDLYNGENIGQNHLLIVPRSDGRCLVASTECWVLIKGGYRFMN